MASAPTPDDVAAACAAAARPLASALAADDGLARRLSEADWPAGVIDEGGQFHRVLVLPGVGAVRMTRTHEAAAHLNDRMATLQILSTTAAFPFAVPVPLTEVVGEADGLPAGMAAVVQEYLPGEAHPPHTGEVPVLRELCRTLAGIDTTPLAPHLGPPFAYRGPWTAEKVAAVQSVPSVLAASHGPGVWTDGSPEAPGGAVSADRWAETVATLTATHTAWTEDPVVTPSLVHGDLAGHNMRWQRSAAEGVGRDGDDRERWHLTGILDWDLAAVWDPALNPAYLALWHGEEKLEAIARDADEALRGRVWLGWMALETIYDASLREGPASDIPPANWPKLLPKVLPRIERAAEALGRWQAEQEPAAGAVDGR
ncbi:phosphotransferase [Citricoccus sp. K5]|uniref:phosphotransferase n=1 Tax=Citricoccus sp. K5 TaxID=2653135 RepID=UPI0012F0DD20|nr:phosphotransferase [Citricoccus sp. K5]VXB09057.1 Aminoglycoside phosphotransferase (APT) family kinase protein [Citricoccus sp. K5]